MKARLMTRLPAGLLAAVFLGLGGCATSGPEVRTDYDASTDFAQYRTFAFATPLGTDREGYQSIVSQRLKSATQREMEARGMRLVTDQPQLLVNFNAAITEKMRVATAPTPVVGISVARGGYYGYRRGMYGAWPVYVDQTTAMPYQEGTLNIDVVDAARKQLVWEGVASGAVTQEKQDKLQSTIDAAVKAIFARYPLPAMQPQPGAK